MDFRELRDENQDTLWIAHKAARLGAYQKLADDIFSALERGWREDPGVNSRLTTAATKILRNVAEELGHLPTRSVIQVERATVDYLINGVKPEDVR